MWRLWIALIVGGVMIFVFGFKETLVGVDASSKPVPVSLVDLEKGVAPPDNNLQVGPHVALYPVAVYEYEVPKHGSQQVNAGTTVNYAYYPIISNQHPFLKEITRLEKKHGSFEKIPETEFPSLEHFSVMVKTTMFRTVGQIPDAIVNTKSVQGLVINRIESLDAEEKRLIGESFPRINLDKLLLVEQGRTPTSSLLSIGVMLLGLIVVGAGAGTPLYLRKQRADDERRNAERRKARRAKARENVREAVASGAVGTAEGEPGPGVADGDAKPAAPPAGARPGSLIRRRRRRR
jgi:hypothetical protein